MDSKTSGAPAPQEQTEVQARQLQAQSQRVFSRDSNEPPRPEYVNNVDFISMGMDVFMDAGNVSPESLNDAFDVKHGGGSPSVKFNVDFRFGMSLQTASTMHQRLTALLKAAATQAVENAKERAETQAGKDETE
jgi:hypothetical protein